MCIDKVRRRKRQSNSSKSLMKNLESIEYVDDAEQREIEKLFGKNPPKQKDSAFNEEINI